MSKRKNKKINKTLLLLLSLFLVGSVSLQSISSDSSQKNKKKDLKPVSLNSEVEQIYFRGEEISYDSKQQVFEIKGISVLEIPRDNLEISADTIKIYKKEHKAEAIGNVIISGRDQVSFSEYLALDFSEQKKQTARLQKIKTKTEFSSIQADQALLQENKNSRTVEYSKNGKAKSAQIVRIASRRPTSLTIREHALTPDEEVNRSKQSYYIQAKTIDFYNDRIQNNLIVKGASLKFKNSPISIPLPFYPLTVGESSQQMFGLIAGNRPNTGARDFNLGPEVNFVLGDPSKQKALHFAPFTQLGDQLGFGGSLGYTDPKTSALLAYGSSKKRFLIELDRVLIPDYLNFQYANNSYRPESGIVKHFAEVYSERNLAIPLIGGILNNEEIKLRLAAAYAQDSQELRDQESNRISDLQSKEINKSEDQEAGRFKLDLSTQTKPIFEYQRKNSFLSLNLSGRLSARQYTTGDFNGFLIISPTLRTKLSSYLDLEISYNQLESTGKSPFGFDSVLLGSSSVTARADLKLTKNFGLTAFSTYSFTNQEYLDQNFGVILGPQNFKFALGFNPFRQRINLEFSTFFNDIFKFRKARFHQKKNLKKKKRFSNWF